MDKVVPNTVIDTEQFEIPASVAAWRALREPRITVWWALELAVREASFPPTLDVYVDTEGNRRWEIGDGKALARKWVMDSFRAFCFDQNITPRNPYSPLAKDFNGEGWQSTFTISSEEFERWLSAYAAKEELATDEGSETTSTQQSIKFIPRQTANKLALLAKLKELGFTLHALPPVPNGKESPAKAAVRRANLFVSKHVLNKAWQDALDDGDIGYQ